MISLRALLFRNAVLAMLMIGAALAVRALVPAGYMPAPGSRTFTVMLCADQNATAIRIAIPMDTPGAPDGKSHHGDSPCAFGSLAGASLGGASPALLQVALDHVIAVGFAPMVGPVLQGFFRLRPPPHAPPAIS